MWKSKVKNNENLWRCTLYRGGFIWGFRDLILRPGPPGVLPPLFRWQLWLCKDFGCPWWIANRARIGCHMWLWISSQLCWEATVGVGEHGGWRLGTDWVVLILTSAPTHTDCLSLLTVNSRFSLAWRARSTQLTFLWPLLLKRGKIGLWEVSEASFSPFVLIKVHWWQKELGSHV